jgi:hypothetical protein
MAKIFLSITILDKPEFKSIYSVYQSILSCRNHQVRIYVNENDSLISRVRNVHLSTFLHDYPDYDYFISIDSDIEIVNCFSSNNIFNKLIEADKDFVGGLYPLKQHEKAPMCSSIPLHNEINRANIPFNSGLIEMLWLSSGCWCVKRKVVEKMVEAYPELTYVGDDNMAGKTIHGLCIPAIFEVDSNGNKFKKFLSEDWAFCERWRKIGGQIHADTSIVLRHLGRIPYTLWNVEVVQKKKEPVAPVVTEANPEANKQMSLEDIQSKLNQNLNKLNENNKKVEDITNKLKGLPVAGHDLEIIK